MCGLGGARRQPLSTSTPCPPGNQQPYLSCDAASADLREETSGVHGRPAPSLVIVTQLVTRRVPGSPAVRGEQPLGQRHRSDRVAVILAQSDRSAGVVSSMRCSMITNNSSAVSLVCLKGGSNLPAQGDPHGMTLVPVVRRCPPEHERAARLIASRTAS